MRRFIFPVFILFAASFLIFIVIQPPPLAVWQGYTSAKKTSISVLSRKNQNLKFFIKKSSLDIEPLIPLKKVQISKRDAVEHFIIENLNLNHEYRFIIENNKGKIIEERIFKTLDLDQSSFVFAAASCMNDKWPLLEQKNMWQGLLSSQPDMIFLIGDNVYADQYIRRASLKNFKKRYIQTFRTLALYQSPRLFPLLAVWDDHDYGMNNGHKNFQYKNEMQKLFRDFFFLPKEEAYLFKGPGVSFLLKAKHQKFFFLDDQSFRSPNSKGSLWGKAQEEWLLKHLSQTKTPSWLVSGSQIFGRHHRFESFEKDFPKNFKNMTRKIFSAKSPVVFLTGDRHLSELLKIKNSPYITYELTTSPIHAAVYPAPKNFSLSKRHLHFVSGKLNYALIKSQSQKAGLQAFIQVYGKGKKLLYSENLSIRK